MKRSLISPWNLGLLLLLIIVWRAQAQAPSITTQPQSQTACPGGTVTLTVVATGSTPLSYFWLKDRSVISGATSSSLTLANVTSANAGTYRVTVRNSRGTVTSAEAVVQVAFTIPSIVTQPANQTALAGNNASFSVVATGCTPLTYQWRKNGVNISGATSATLSLSNVQAADATDYSVVVTNPGGSRTSNAATLTVTPAAPTITSQPQSQSVSDGGSVTLSVAAKGTTPFTYQWKRNGTAVSGATSATLVLNPVQTSDAGTYTADVSNSVGSASSASATLTVTAVAPTITSQPQSLTVIAGNSATFSVTASGTAPLSYQWRKAGNAISGATTSSYTINNAQANDAGDYSVTVSNTAGSVTSSTATLSVNAASTTVTSISLSPANPSITVGETVSLAATGVFSDSSSRTLTGGGGSWTAKSGMLTPRWEPSVGVLNGTVIAAGGYSHLGGHQVVVHAYSSGSWTSKNNRPFIQTAGAYAVIDNYLYVAGGTDCCVAISTLSRYDPATDSWSTLASLPSGARSHVAGAAINGLFYAAGGVNGSSRLEVYNPANNSWTVLASLPTSRVTAAGAALSGLLYVVGGSTASQSASAVVEAYNPANDSWATRSSMATARFRLTAVVLNDLLYAIGGNDGANELSVVEVYDALSNTWLSLASMPTARTSPAAVALNGKILAIGGYQGSGTAVNTTEEFTPPEVMWISSNPSAASVTSSGVVTGVSAGTATITALSGGAVRSSTTVTVAVSGAGDLDSTFGSNGKVTAAIGTGNDHVRAIAIQPDGKVVVVGHIINSGNSELALARFNTDGSLDTSFGTNGKVTGDFNGTGDLGDAVALQSDGKIVVGNGSGGGPATLVRCNANGTLDTTFGTNGKVAVDLGGTQEITGVAIQPDGKIVIVGLSNTGSCCWYFVVARYTSSGSDDTSFGGSGRVSTDFTGADDTPAAIALQPDGKILAAGRSNGQSGSGDNSDFALARYNTDGSLDTTFGTSGKVTTDLGGTDDIYAVALQSNGKIVVAGRTRAGSNNNFGVARYNADGTLDTGFGANGKVTIDFGSNSDIARGVVVQSDGRIVVAGNTSSDFAIARLDSDGSLDDTFGTAGKSTSDFGGTEQVYAAAAQSDGNLVVAGESNVAGTYDFAVARYLRGSSSGGLTLASSAYLGGAGEHRGTGVAYAGSALYVSGFTSDTGNGSDSSVIAKYAVPPQSTPTWSRTFGSGSTLYAVAAGTDALYAPGFSYSLTTDSVGGKEVKAIAAKFPLDGSTDAGPEGTIWVAGSGGTTTRSSLFSYGGGEIYRSIVWTSESGSPVIYVAGGGQPCSYSSYIVSKFDVNGNRVASATDSTVGIQFGQCYIPSEGGSDANAITLADGNVVLAGGTSWNFEGDWPTPGGRPVLWIYSTGLNLVSRQRDGSIPGHFLGVTTLGSAIYAVGVTYTAGVANSEQYLIQKFDTSGSRLWSKSSGGSNSDYLKAVVAVGSRLFAVGYTKSEGSGGADAVILELDPSTGDTLSTTLYGGAQDDIANAVTTDGTDLYVVGETKSVATGGNSVGENEIFLLRYTISSGSPNRAADVLTAFARPVLRAVRAVERFQVSIDTIAGKTYVLETKDSLTDPDWKPVTSSGGDGATKILTDPSAPKTQRFYRVRVR